MTKVVSDQQRLANQENAQKSTGPRSDEGKARVARNALKHGLLAKDLLQSADGPEDHAEFDAILADLSASRFCSFRNRQLAIGNRQSASTLSAQKPTRRSVAWPRRRGSRWS